jgi:DNA-binding IclR family transcriptional regulator
MDANAASTEDRQFVEALARGLKLLDCFQPEQPILTNGELARMTGLACSSVSRLTHTLVKMGYLDYDSEAGAYRLGFRVLSMHQALIAGTDVAALVLPHMKRLAEVAEVRVALLAYEEPALVILQAVDGGRPLVSPMAVGASYALPGTAMGRAYLATCSSSEKTRILNRLVHLGVATADALASELKEAESSYAQLRYCTSFGAWRPGLHAVAVPIYLRNLGRRVVLSCGVESSQFTPQRVHEVFGPLLLSSAADIESSFARPRLRMSSRSRPAKGRGSAPRRPQENEL